MYLQIQHKTFSYYTPVIKGHLWHWSPVKQTISCVCGYSPNRSYFSLNTLLSYPVALSCTLIFMETKQRLPRAETGAWLDCLSVLNEMCLQNKPMRASIPKTSLVCHIKSQGTSPSLVSYFLLFCSLMWDIRAYSSSPESHSEDWQKMGCCLLPSCTHYGHLAIPCWTGNIISNVVAWSK